MKKSLNEIILACFDQNITEILYNIFIFNLVYTPLFTAAGF